MGATVSANNQTVVHKDSGGTVVTSPDVCNTPIGPAVAQVPYINIAKSSDTSQGSTTVTMDGNPVMLSDSVFDTSYGDEPGKIGGVSSGVNRGKARFVTTSSDVFVEGKPVGRRMDLMISNLSGAGNTPPAALQQPNVSTDPKDNDGYVLSAILDFKHPNGVTGDPDQPRLNLPYTVSGPDTFENKEEHIYQSAQRKMAQPGSYSFKIDDFRRENGPATRAAKNKQPV
jgi:hypothetical protein